MSDTEEHAKVTAANEAYDKLVASKTTSDNFSERAAQTFNFAPKSKESMAAPAAATTHLASRQWDIMTHVSRRWAGNRRRRR